VLKRPSNRQHQHKNNRSGERRVCGCAQRSKGADLGGALLLLCRNRGQSAAQTLRSLEPVEALWAVDKVGLEVGLLLGGQPPSDVAFNEVTLVDLFLVHHLCSVAIASSIPVSLLALIKLPISLSGPEQHPVELQAGESKIPANRVLIFRRK